MVRASSRCQENFEAVAIALKFRTKQSATDAVSSPSGDHCLPGPSNSFGGEDSMTRTPSVASGTSPSGRTDALTVYWCGKGCIKVSAKFQLVNARYQPFGAIHVASILVAQSPQQSALFHMDTPQKHRENRYGHDGERRPVADAQRKPQE